MHGGGKFEILTDSDGEVLLCLHAWEEGGHPTMTDKSITPGNGFILYFRTNLLEETLKNAKRLNVTIEEEMHMNRGSKRKEFSLRDPDGYYITVSAYHTYEG